MNKRKIIIVLAIIIFIIVLFGVIGCSKKENSNLENMQVENNYQETETSINFVSRNPSTEIRSKTITISPFQSAKILINKEVESGDIYIDIIESHTSQKKDISTGLIEIEEGFGEYTIQIDTKEFIGYCDISWEISDNKKAELYTSTKGYELKYDPNKFKFEIIEGKDKFTFLEDENDIYFMVEAIESDNIKEIKDNLIATAESTGNCRITESNLEGIYTENKNENMKKQHLIFEVNEKKLIVIEINMYANTEGTVLPNLYIKNMIKTFKINED